MLGETNVGEYMIPIQNAKVFTECSLKKGKLHYAQEAYNKGNC